MEIWSTFLLGLVGSLHCVGMCGPLALALPVTGKSFKSFLAGRLVYNFGRITTYAMLGAIFGLIGKSFALAGFQRWISIAAGSVILIALFSSSRLAVGRPILHTIASLKSGFSKLLQRRTLGSLGLLGLLNGLLPCGLVYAACAVSASSGGFISGIQSMLLFGLGTTPVMLGAGLAGKKFQFAFAFKAPKLVPATLALVAGLLIVRGLSLGIPYLSPDLYSRQFFCH